MSSCVTITRLTARSLNEISRWKMGVFGFCMLTYRDKEKRDVRLGLRYQSIMFHLQGTIEVLCTSNRGFPLLFCKEESTEKTDGGAHTLATLCVEQHTSLCIVVPTRSCVWARPPLFLFFLFPHTFFFCDYLTY